MEVPLTWDLLVMIFFVLIMSYSYIVGRNGTIKIVLACYVAMLASNGLGNLLEQSVQSDRLVIQSLALDSNYNVVLFKIIVFILFTLVLVLRGAFIVDIGREDSAVARFVVTSIFGFLTAGLILSTILVFMVGDQVDGILMSQIAEAIDLPEQSRLVVILVKYYNFWFAAPAVAFIGLSFMSNVVLPVVED